jgi:hypothetical protein
MAEDEWSDYGREIRELLSKLPISTAQMSDKQVQACILYQLYELNKHLKHLDQKLNRIELKIDNPKVKFPYG